MEITLELTRECTLNCIICSSNGGVCDKNELTTKEWMSIIEEASHLGAKRICISGGEPFLREDFDKIIKYCKLKNLGVVVYTSGNIYNSERTEIVPVPKELLVKWGKYIDRLAFGIQGPDAKTHDKITAVEGSFAKLLKTIKHAIEAGIEASGHFVPVKSNFRLISETIQLGKEIGLSGLGVLRFVPQGRGYINKTILELTDREIKELVRIIHNLDSAEREFLKIGSPFSDIFPDLSSKCSLGNRLTIEPDGIIAPCEAMKDFANERMIFNVRRNSLQDVLQSNWIQDLISEYKNRSPEGKVCKFCIAQEMLKTRDNQDVAIPDESVRITH